MFMYITGVGGNLVAVQASRLSTALHQVSTPGILPESAVQGCPNCINTYFDRKGNVITLNIYFLDKIFIYRY